MTRPLTSKSSRSPRFYAALGLTRFRLLINSMGDKVCRPAYVELLRAHLAANVERLCDEHKNTWSKTRCGSSTARTRLRRGDDRRPDARSTPLRECRAHLDHVIAGL